ncbi:MAG TPA: hypothetical protein VHR72_06610 [Gemmataceae bacterium]|nr:hypothetical protein [Gemmataceae bacterium]
MKRLLTLACLSLLGLANFAAAEQGNPKLKTIEAIAFGPKGLLLIGGGPQVVSVDTGDTTMVPWTTDSIANIDQILAGKLGLTPKDIEVRKLAVNPASGKAYIAIQSLKNKASVILTVDGAGKIAEFPLENVKFTSYSLAMPKGIAVTKVTDIAWTGGKIVAATQATDKFSSRVFTIDPATTDGAAKQISTKTYHTGHNRWETQAPLRALMPYIENGKASVVGTFTCTPIVRYSIDDAKNNDQVVGTSVVELGQGNTPRSMFTYEKDGKKFILISVGRNNKQPAYGFPSAYWVAKVDATLLDETKNINEKAALRVPVKGASGAMVGDRVQVAREYFGVRQMDKLDANRAVAIIETKDAFSLRALPLP